MNYSQAKAHKLELESAHKSATDAMKKYRGLRIENLRVNPEWQAERKRSIAAFHDLHFFNKWFFDNFQHERLAELPA